MNISYKCSHCGKEKGKHQATTHNCPLPSSRRDFRCFHNTNVYTADLSKPIKPKGFTI